MQRPTHVVRGFTRPLAVIAAALAFGISGIAAAQPHGAAMHGGPGADGMIAGALQAVKARLNLNTSQQVAWDAAVNDSKTVRQAARARMQQVHDALTAELAHPEPNFAAIATLGDQAQQDIGAQRLQVRNEWLSLYSTFTAEQKAIVRDAVAQRVARMDQFRARMLQHRGPGG